MCNAVETLFLYGAIEPLDMRLVVFLPDAAVPMQYSFLQKPVCEAGRELAPVVCLDHQKMKRRDSLCAVHESGTLVHSKVLNYLRICPSRVQIDDGVYVYS